MRKSDDITYPTACPACRKITGNPARVETVKHHQQLLRIDLSCSACGHRWQEVVGVANLVDDPQTSAG